MYSRGMSNLTPSVVTRQIRAAGVTSAKGHRGPQGTVVYYFTGDIMAEFAEKKFVELGYRIERRFAMIIVVGKES
jgi:hypothetical protein